MIGTISAIPDYKNLTCDIGILIGYSLTEVMKQRKVKEKII